MDAVQVGLQARVEMAHAVVEALARAHAIDLLHVKGPALDPSLSDGGRGSTDADVLVRPEHVALLATLLARHGWRLVTGFASGSAFEHAANYRHEQWGYVDVHRSFPGLGAGSGHVFETLWSSRSRAELAHRPCAVPSLLDQRLLLVVHAARDGRSVQGADDVRRAWWDLDPSARQQLRSRSVELGAQVALAAAIGELDRHRTDPTADLWRVYSQGGSRLSLLRARVRAAPTAWAALRVLTGSLRVNAEYVAMVLGHEPSPAELADARRERRRRAAGDVRDAALRLLRRTPR